MFDPISILSENTEVALKIYLGYEELWESIYGEQNGIWNATMFLAERIACFSFINYSIEFVYGLIENRARKTFQKFMWGLTVIILFNNNGFYLAHLTQGLRTACFEQTKMVYETQIKGIALGNAVKDVILTKELNRDIERDYAACGAKTGTEQVKCVERTARQVKERIESIQAKIDRLGIRAEGINILKDRTVAVLAQSSSAEIRPTTGYPTIFVSTVAKALIFNILKGFQWLYSQSMELGQLVTGLYGPIALVLTLFELPFPPLYSWLLGFLTIGFINWSYAIVVGLVCWVMVIQGLQTYSDFGFLLFMSLGAPGLSIYLAKRGGAAIYENFLQNGTTVLKTAFMGVRLFL